MTMGAPRRPILAPIPQESTVAPSGTVTTGTEGAVREIVLPPTLIPMLPVSVPPIVVLIVGRAMFVIRLVCV